MTTGERLGDGVRVDQERKALDCARDILGDSFPGMSQYVDILINRGVTWGLLGPREPDRIWGRHILNCLALMELIPHDARMVDVGSGAGLPGLVLAIARPDLRVTLLDPLLRRSDFLLRAVQELDVDDRVRVVRSRAEDHRERYRVVTARAVAKLPKLLSWVVPLMDDGADVLALKGSSAADEVSQTQQFLTRHRLSAELLHPEPCSGFASSVVRVRHLPAL